MADKTSVLKIGADGSQAKAEVASVGKSLNSLGAAARQAGTDASHGLAQVAQASKETSNSSQREFRNWSSAIQRETDRVKASLQGVSQFEVKAARLGFDDAAVRKFTDELNRARGQLDALNAANAATSRAANFTQATASLEKMGMSAKATAAAMRGVPAQIQDIIVSLQGGQAPMTVLLQQGSQLSGMFGGMGAAAKAVGGYVIGLINPFTVAAGAIAGIGYAMYRGAEQQRAYQNALTLTGNAAGLTSAQLEAMEKRIAGAGNGYGETREALLELVKAGKVSGEALEGVARSVAKVARATGRDIKDVAKEYASIAEAPLDAIVKLTKESGALSAAIYQQAEALIKAGRETEAVTLVQQTYAENTEKLAKKAAENIGWIEQAWKGAKNAASAAAEGLMGLGKEANPADIIAAKEKELQRLREMLASGGFGSNAGGAAFGGSQSGAAFARERVAALELELSGMKAVAAAQEAAAKSEQEAAAARKEGVAAMDSMRKGYESVLTVQQKLAEELRKAQQDYDRIKASPIDASGAKVDMALVDEQYRQRIRAINSQFQPKIEMDRLLDALAMQESGGRQFDSLGRTITSRTGALGMYQIQPQYGSEFARLAGVDWNEQSLRTDPEYGRKLAKAFLDSLLRQFDGNLEQALTAYNQGAGGVRNALRKAAASGGDYHQFLGPDGQAYSRGVLSKFDKDYQGNYVGGPRLNQDAIDAQKRIREEQDATRQSTAALIAEQEGYNKVMSAFIGLKATDHWKTLSKAEQESKEASAKAASNNAALADSHKVLEAATQSAASAWEEYNATLSKSANFTSEVAAEQARYDKVMQDAAKNALDAATQQAIQREHLQAMAALQEKSAVQQANALAKQADQLEEANKYYGLSAISIGAMKAARLEDALAAEKQANGVTQLSKALEEQLKQQTRVNEATKQAEFNKIADRLDEWNRSAREQAKLYEDEARFAGLTALERAKTVALRQVELRLAKELAEIDKWGGNTPEDEARREEARQRARKAAVIDGNNAINKVVREDWEKTADSINQSLTDALLRGFEDGKGFGKNFADTLKNMFKTLVLRPIISFIVQPIGNAISSMISGFLGGGQGGGGLLGNLFSGASNGNSLMSMFGGTGGNLGAISGYASGGMSFANAAGSIYANTTGTGISGLLATNGAYGTAGAGAGGAGAGLGGLATGMAMVAIPLIIGAIIENNSRDRTGGAAFATSDWRNDPGTAAGSGTGYDTATNQLPAYQDMVDRMVELGHSQNMTWYEQFKGNERALYAVLYQAEEMARGNTSEFQALPDGKDITEMYGDFYRGQGYADPASMGWWNWKDVDFASVDPQVVAASRQLSMSIVDTLTQTARAIGQDGDFRVTTGWANRGKGDLWGAAQIMRDGQEVAGFNRSDYKDTQHYMQAVFSATMDAFKTFDLPQWATNMVDDTKKKIDALDGDKVGQEAAALYQQASQQVVATLNAIKMLIDVFPDFAGATQDAVYNIAQAMGGIDNLNSAYAGYIQNFYSQAEQADLARKQMEAQFAAVGMTMPASREAFRAMVEALDLTTEQGQQAFATMMGLSGAFAQLTADSANLMGAAFEGADQLASVIRDGLLGNLSSQQVGEQMADVVMGGIYNAIAGGFANQITQIMMDGVVTPMLQAALAGTSVTEAVSQAAIDKMIADATAAAQALGQILNSEGFQAAMGGIQNAMQQLAPQITAPKPYYTPYSVRNEQAQREADARAQAAQRAQDEAARQAQQIANQRLGLTKQLLQLEGNTNALRQLELQALDPSNRALQERIWALQDEAEAEAKRAEAMKEATEFLGGFTKNIQEFIFNTRMQQAMGVESYQLAAGKFSAQLALARGGDRDALNGITGYADTLIGRIRAESTSGDEANLRIGRVLGQLGDLPKQVSAEQLIVNAVDSMKNTLSGVLIEKFDALDSNVDGLLTFGELQASGLASDAQIRAMIARVDANGDGMISKTEAVRAQAELTKLGVNNVNTSVGNNTAATNSWGQTVNSSTVSGLNSVYGRVGDVDMTGISGNTISQGILNLSAYLTQIKDSTQSTSNDSIGMRGLLVASYNGVGAFKVTSRNTGQGDWAMFAKGGVFTNQIVDGPTPFNMGLMGEAGPEAIMPLVRTSTGELAIRALNGGSEAGLAAVQASIERLDSNQQAQAGAIVALQRASSQSLNKLLRLAESQDRNGTPIPRGTVLVKQEAPA